MPLHFSSSLRGEKIFLHLSHRKFYKILALEDGPLRYWWRKLNGHEGRPSPVTRLAGMKMNAFVGCDMVTATFQDCFLVTRMWLYVT
jgi:hypothetical protein